MGSNAQANMTLSKYQLFIIAWAQPIDRIIVIILMASQYTAQLLSLGRSLAAWPHRLFKFLRHRMLTQRKNILIIGDQDSPIYTRLHPLLASSWEIVHIAEAQPPVAQQQGEVPLSETDAPQAKPVEKQIVTAASNKFFKRMHLYGENYQQIEKQLEGKQFDSIVVLPNTDENSTLLDIDHEDFALQYPQVHQEALMRNLLAYRLASKCLTSSGVVILSISQYDFTKEYAKDGRDGQAQVKDKKEQLCSSKQGNIAKKVWFSNELVDAQVSYLGVVIGDRDYTDLNSWSVVALSKQLGEEEPEWVAKYYKLWADSQQLPMPGTFALFKRKTAQSNSHFVQYL